MTKVVAKICQVGGGKHVAFAGLLAATLLLSACGFHLKGMGDAATATYQSIKIVQNPGVRSDVAQALNQQLQAMGIKVVSNLADAELVLNLQATQMNTSITARDGKGDVSGELLKMIQPFNAQVVATEESVIQARAVAYRDRSVNAAQAQASSRELQSIQRQMASEVALQVLDRLNRAYALMHPAKQQEKKATDS
ncbi:LPS assembly lipoprotein LptE [Hydrogenovibrio marinus]|uniref:LPS-assembly lipoprotein LptE n=1 Tax=Hydrogenovibrio marinus TaxID=28885 RepID=A0A067A1I5_HYDMR|nr:LPS assembly lipoprotein LptE [Hydrogenovibrio marinus]KDN96486.1 hypothetical protein EI16_09495 [Hydrogenovibrio marinus]BBN60315.1 hypothetical protein HVMH_1909 [Hydrogenovibrio marinus]